MGTLVLTRIFPNPPGKDASHGHTTNEKLNQEWVEFAAAGSANSLAGVGLHHLTFGSNSCAPTGSAQLVRFSEGSLAVGEAIQVHTGSGQTQKVGAIWHFYLGRDWFVWNNGCGDSAMLDLSGGSQLDRAGYRPRPPERVMVRVSGADRFE